MLKIQAASREQVSKHEENMIEMKAKHDKEKRIERLIGSERSKRERFQREESERKFTKETITSRKK